MDVEKSNLVRNDGRSNNEVQSLGKLIKNNRLSYKVVKNNTRKKFSLFRNYKFEIDYNSV